MVCLKGAFVPTAPKIVASTYHSLAVGASKAKLSDRHAMALSTLGFTSKFHYAVDEATIRQLFSFLQLRPSVQLNSQATDLIYT